MTSYFVSRHPGAVDWAAQQRLQVDHFVQQLDPATLQSGDTIIGSLPVHLAAEVCARGSSYWHLCLALPFEMRGRDLSATDLQSLGAHIKPYHIEPAIQTGTTPP